jgi:Ca2+-dependent lipid-binding protein
MAQRTIARSSLDHASVNNNKLASTMSVHQIMGGGLLNLMIIKAELSRDTDYLSDMDPYVEIVYKKEVQKTPILHNAGKTPEWDISMKPIVIDLMEDYIKFTVFDKDLNTSDEIGEVTIRVGTLCSLDFRKKWLNLAFRGIEAGDLLIESKYTPPVPETRETVQ